MFRAILYFILFYLVYEFIFKFLVPVYKTTKQVRKGFRDMQDRVNESSSNTQSASAQTGSTKVTSDKESLGEYIEFEEVK